MDEQHQQIIGQMVNDELQRKIGRLEMENAELRARNSIMSQYINNLQSEEEGKDKDAELSGTNEGKKKKAKPKRPADVESVPAKSK